MNRTTRLAVAVAATLAATVAMTPAVSADTVARQERRGDAPRHIDLTRFTIDNGDTKPRWAIIRIRTAGKLRPGPDDGDVVTVWFDRDRDPRPDLRMDVLFGWEWEMWRVNGWNGQVRPADCPHRVKTYRDRHGIKIRIARSCLNNRPVRVAVRSVTIDDGSRYHDWFRGRRTFLPGVRH